MKSTNAPRSRRSDIEIAMTGADVHGADYGDLADAVIQYLWQRADDPATYAEVASKMYRRHDLNTFELGTAQQYVSMMLETLLGPRPNGEEAADER